MSTVDLPGPRAVPLAGYRGNFLAFAADPVKHLHRLHDEYGEVAALARGHSGHVFVFSPRLNQVVLSDPGRFQNVDASSSPLRMRPDSSLRRLYAGLTNMNGERHRRVRRLMAPALQRRHVEECAADITDVTEHHLAGWHDGDRLDLLAEMRTLTMAVAVKTLLGLEPEDGGRVTGRLLGDWMDAVFSVPAMALPLDLPGLPYHRLQVLSARLERVVRDIIRRRREGPAGGRDVLARLAHADDDGVRLSDEELVGQTAFLFMAGHATTAAALTWTLLLLATHPAVLGDEPDDALLNRVIKESLRLLPPVTWWGKVSTSPFDLGPYRLDAGTTVVFSPYITHRLPGIYPEPDRFRPDRWLTCDPSPYEYLPFSAGARGCLGAGFAMLEMRIVLSMILRRWRPQLRPGARVDRGGLMVSQPRRGLPVTLVPVGGRRLPVSLRGDVRALLDLGSNDEEVSRPGPVKG